MTIFSILPAADLAHGVPSERKEYFPSKNVFGNCGLFHGIATCIKGSP
jgi:hypothetical protein